MNTQTPTQPSGSVQPSSAARRVSARSSYLWSAGSRITVQAIQFISTAVLARLLTPADYGLVAIVLTLTGFAYFFSELGIGSALIHSRSVKASELTTAFWVNAATGLILTAIFAGLAVPISAFYGEPALTPLILVASLTFSLSLNVVPSALLQRDLRFKAVACIELIAAVTSSSVGIGGALLGSGAISLVYAALTQTIVISLAMIITTGFRPRGRPTRQAWQALWSYSGPLLGFNVLNYWSRNVDNLIVGKLESPAQLGYYARAYNLMMLPIGQVTFVIGRVLFPVLARVQDDLGRLRGSYLRTMTVAVALATPLSAILATSAPAFVRVVYGDQWDAVAPLLAILACSGPAQVIAGTTGALYQAIGRTAHQFRRGIVGAIVTVVAVIVGIHWGAAGVAVALLVKFYLLLPLAVHGCWPAIGLEYRTVAKALWPIWSATGLLVAAAMAVQLLMPGSPAWFVLPAQAASGAAAYLLGLTLFGRPILRNLRNAKS